MTLLFSFAHSKHVNISLCSLRAVTEHLALCSTGCCFVFLFDCTARAHNFMNMTHSRCCFDSFQLNAIAHSRSNHNINTHVPAHMPEPKTSPSPFQRWHRSRAAVIQLQFVSFLRSQPIGVVAAQHFACNVTRTVLRCRAATR